MDTQPVPTQAERDSWRTFVCVVVMLACIPLSIAIIAAAYVINGVVN